MTTTESGIGKVAGPEYASLQYVDGYAIPEPRTRAHEQVLWQAVNIEFGLAKKLSEATLTRYVASSLSNPYSLETTQLAYKAVMDAMKDRLIVRAAAVSYSPNDLVPLSRLLFLSGLGYQIAAESARRVAQNSAGNEHADRVNSASTIYTRAMGRLLTAGMSRDKGPGKIKFII